MKTTRRKFEIYPVALAIAFLIASSGRAQLCPTATTNSGVAGFSEQTVSAPPLVKTSVATLADPASVNTQSNQSADRTSAPFAAVPSPEMNAQSMLPPAAVAHEAPSASSQPRDDVVHKLLLAASLPAGTEVSLQPMFAD